MDKDCDQYWWLIFCAWFISAISFAGSLFFSEIMEFLPCTLCWYQRIAMYPLVLMLGIGLFPVKREVFKFSIPLVVIGLFIALYHNLLHWGIISEDMSPCVEGIPCSVVYIEWLGFITIPLLSLTAFTLILICLLLFRKRTKYL